MSKQTGNPVALWEKRMGALAGEIQAQHDRVMASTKRLAANSPAAGGVAARLILDRGRLFKDERPIYQAIADATPSEEAWSNYDRVWVGMVREKWSRWWE